MIRTFTKQELTDRWRLVRYLEPQRNDVTMTFDGADMSRLDEAEVEEWWERTIDTAPLDFLKLKEMKGKAQTAIIACDESVELRMPDQYPLRRPGRIRLEGWKKDGRIVEAGSREALLQLNPYTRATAENPVAVVLDSRHLSLFPATSDNLETLMAVDPEDYTFDERCLKTMRDGCTYTSL